MSTELRVLLGVSGGIAACKAPALVRRLRERGHEVRCALSRNATAFVTPLTLEILSARPVYQQEYLEPTGQGEELHIAAAEWCQVLCIAPATAHVLARLALGLADDFLTTTTLAFDGPTLLVPAMHRAMWSRDVVQEHVTTLRRRGVGIAGPVEGALASGEQGMGRMLEPNEIVHAVEEIAGSWTAARMPFCGPLAGRKVVVSAGPTQEPIDPVRYLANRSSGKMGFALAREAARRGAEVVLVSGPVSLETPPGVARRDVATALEMEQALSQVASGCDLLIMAAAVSDYRPVRSATQKIKRQSDPVTLTLEPNPDILAGLSQTAAGAVRVGFAAETEDLEAHAQAKLDSKGVEFLVANDVSRSDIGFGSDSNEVVVFRRQASPVHLVRKPKVELAGELLDLFAGALSSVEE